MAARAAESRPSQRSCREGAWWRPAPAEAFPAMVVCSSDVVATCLTSRPAGCNGGPAPSRREELQAPFRAHRPCAFSVSDGRGQCHLAAPVGLVAEVAWASATRLALSRLLPQFIEPGERLQWRQFVHRQRPQLLYQRVWLGGEKGELQCGGHHKLAHCAAPSFGVALALQFLQHLLSAMHHLPRDTRELRHVDAIALVGAAWHDLAQKDHLTPL